MIEKDLIFLDLEVQDKQEAIAFLADKLLKAGKVKDTYMQAVLDREKSYPTGLSFGTYAIAMPHTFAQHVNEPCIAVARLKNTVKFVQMGTNDTEVDVGLIMMMAITNPEEQIGYLKKILTLYSSKDNILGKVMDSNSIEEIYDYLKCIND